MGLGFIEASLDCYLYLDGQGIQTMVLKYMVTGRKTNNYTI